MSKRKYQFRQKKRQAAILRKKRKSRNKKKQKNKQKNNRPRIKVKKRKSRTENYTGELFSFDIVAGEKLQLFIDPDPIIKIVRKLDAIRNSHHGRKVKINIDLRYVKSIDLGAISFLLAKIREVSRSKKIRINGNYPEDETCKKIFEQSGFLDYMVDMDGRKIDVKTKNFIVNVGQDRTRSEKVGETIAKTLEHLTGVKQSYPPVYGIIQEICSNSVEWANHKSKDKNNWFLGVNYNESEELQQRTATFIMTDVGLGIIKTLNINFGHIILGMKIVGDNLILQRAFDGEYGSRSLERNRNNGLPMIKKKMSQQQIDNLIVITNKVHMDFKSESKTKILNRNFPGTMYCWTLDNKCIERWKEKRLY